MKRATCIFLVLLAVFAAELLSACGATQAPAEAAPSTASRSVSVHLVPATSGSISVTMSYAAIVEAKDLVNVVPQATGRVERLTVDIGSEVRQGQVIAELSHGTLDAQLHKEQAGLRDAQAKLASLQVVAELKKNRSQAELESARVKLDQLLNPSTSDLQIASSKVAMAQSKLDSSNTRLSQLLNPTEADLAEAQHAVAEARSKLVSAQQKVTEAISEHLSQGTLSGEAKTVWRILLAAQISLQASRAILAIQPTTGGKLATDDIDRHEQVVAANQKIISSLLESGPTSPIPENIAIAIVAESEAQHLLNSTTAKLTELQSPSPSTIALAQHDIDAAQAELGAAQAELSLLESPNPTDLAAARAQVAGAEETLSLNQLVSSRYDIEAGQAQVDQAQAQVDLIQEQLAELQVLAPYDGSVTRRWLAPGAMASSQSPIVTIASKGLVVSLKMEETGVNSLLKGQRVTFTSPARSGQSLDLEVGQIATSGDEKSHNFAVLMYPLEAAPDLKPGMSGQVSLVVKQEDVVLVPKEGVLYQGGQPTLFVVQDGRAYSQIVEIGMVDDKSVEIRSGVQAGDQVVVSGQGLLVEGDLVTIEEKPSRQSGS